MRKLLKKIPLLIWAVVLTFLAFYVIKQDLITDLTSNQINLMAGCLTFIGLIFVAINLQKQWKNERIKTEYLNQPDFYLKGFSEETFEGSGPVLCPNPTQCTDDHWLDIIQTGNLAAKNLKVALFHKDEAKENIEDETRWLLERRLGKGDDFQYKLPQFTIPYKYYNRTYDNCFFLLLEYKSEYSNIEYKRIYRLWASPIKNPENKTENDWKGKIFFYSENLAYTMDSDSISIFKILRSKWNIISKFLGLRKHYSYEEWLIDV